MIRLNGNPINITMFPDGTSQVWKIPEEILNSTTNYAHITWEFNNEGEFLHLAQLKQLLDPNKEKIDLRLKYLPYGRQDKNVSNTATFALNTFAYLLNQLKFDTIIIVDPHSKVALELIQNSVAHYPIHNLIKAIELTKPQTICYPDKGAVSKYSDLPIYGAYRFIYGEKVRDQLTGNITSYEVIGDPKDKIVLIVDDICDGGMTFKILTKDLLAQGAKEVNLFVTHGIFSKGLRTLKESGIKRIFTQDGEAEEMQNNIIYKKL